MPPKRNKSSTPSGASPSVAVTADKTWEAALSAAVFEESEWRASLSVVQVEKAEDECLISSLLQAVQKPLRKHFCVLSWKDTLDKINELGNPKMRKTKDVPMFVEVTEVVKIMMDAGEELTMDLTAKLIKFQLLNIKNDDIARRSSEKKALEEMALVKAGLNPLSKDQGGKGAAKGKKAVDVQVPTKDTKLKRRGEDENTVSYIDDEPDDGPQLYILISGFYKPLLISALDSLGVHISNIIKLDSHADSQQETPEDRAEGENPQAPEDQELDAAQQKRQEKLDLFWMDLDQVLNSADAGSKVSDVARLSYDVKISIPEDKDDPEAMLAFGAHIFEGVACLIYDSLDWRRHHSHYLSCMRLIQVPVACRPSTPIQETPKQRSTEALQFPLKKVISEEDPDVGREPETPVLSTEVDMRYYCDLLNRIPAEITSVPLILHCMMEQVVASQQETQTDLVDSEQQFVKTQEDLMGYMLSSVLSLAQDEELKKELLKDLGIQQSSVSPEPICPLLLNHHDERARRLHRLPVLRDFDTASIEADMMKQSLLWTGLMSHFSENTADKVTRSQELMYFCTDESVGWCDVQRLLQLFVFESMPLTSVDESGFIIGSNTPDPTPWDRPEEFAKHLFWRMMTESSKSLAWTDQHVGCEVTLTDLQKTLIRQLDNSNFSERHSACVFPQVLKSASETYKCVDAFLCGRDNTLYVLCHNPMSPRRSCREFWEASLHTDVGFRNYLEHVADTITNWIKQEEEKWQKEQEKREAERVLLQTPTETDDSSVNPPVSEGYEQYIREDSLKAWKIEKEVLKEEEQMKKTKKEKGDKTTSKTVEKGNSAKDKKTPVSAKKSRENTQTPTSKTPSSTMQTDKRQDVLETPLEGSRCLFTGYALNGNLVRVTGKLQSLYPCDGGQIEVDRFSFVQGLTQMKVCVKKDGHHFYTHMSERTEDDKANKEDATSERPGSFYAVLSNGIQLSCVLRRRSKTKSQTLQPTVPKHLSRNQPHPEQVSVGLDVPCDSADDSSPPFLILYISLPNGLILHIDSEISADGESGDLLIHQRYFKTSSSSDENRSLEVSRVITSRGTVVKHKRDGSTEVLFADGTVSVSPDSGPVFLLVPRLVEPEPVKEQTVDTKDTKEKKGKAESKPHMEPEQKKAAESRKPNTHLELTGGSWMTTTPSGQRVASVAGREVEVPQIQAYHMTDPFSGTVVVTREDRVMSVLKKDGTVIVDHADGTRITTFHQQGELQHLSSEEKRVMVEKQEFATVMMNFKERTCEILLGDGTSIRATAQGSYEIYPHGGGVLHIDESGGAIYTSHQSQPEKDLSNQYVMNCKTVLCHVTDSEGNHFQINADGQVTVTGNASEKRPPDYPQTAGFKTHPPRLFVVHKDGSASELLRAEDVEDLLQEAYGDPSIAVLSEPLSGSGASSAITLLRPCTDFQSKWLISKQDDDIIPSNLKSRKWESFPASEKKTSGPAFGTSLGSSPEKRKPVISISASTKQIIECPNVLLVRQITQHAPTTEKLRRKLLDKVKAYVEQLLQRERQWEMMKLKDPQTADEGTHHKRLLQLVLSLPEDADASVHVSVPSDVASRYTQALQAAHHLQKLQERTEDQVTVRGVNKKKQKSQWEQRINQHRLELQEQKRHITALRRRIVTPYFHPELQEMSIFTDSKPF